MKTIQEKLQDSNYRPTGFQYLRIFLAVYVILAHTDLICNRSHTGGLLSEILTLGANIRVPAFFIFSGFLVAASLERSPSILEFAAKRILRIVPPLAVMIVITSLIIGPIFTKYSLKEYFFNPEFWRYQLNSLGFFWKDLPGVFTQNPTPYDVAGHLWIIQVEIGCYFALAVLYKIGLYQRASAMIALGFCLYLLQFANLLFRDVQTNGATATIAVMCFFCGAIINRLRYKIRYSKLILTLSLVSIGLLVMVPNGIRFIAFPLAIATVYFGVYNPPKYRFYVFTKYSYGIFLYSLPIQQILVASNPFFENMIPNFITATILAICAGSLSWNLIEKPLLFLRRSDRGEKGLSQTAA